MSIASRIAAQGRAGGRGVSQTTRGGTTYKTTTGQKITPAPATVQKIYLEEVSQETFVDPGLSKTYDARAGRFLTRSEEQKRGIGAIVMASEYIKHHAATYGTTQDKNLGAGLDNLYSDEHAVIPIDEGVTAVVNQTTNEVDVIHDRPLSEEERTSIRSIIDKAGDTPNTTIFVEGGYSGGAYSEAGEAYSEAGEIAPDSRSSGAIGKVSSGALLLVVGVIVVIYFLFGGKK